MRPRFFTVHLSPDEKRTIRWSYLGIVFGYTAIILVVFATVNVRNRSAGDDLNAAPCPAQRMTSDPTSRARGFVTASHALAAETNPIARSSRAEQGSAPAEARSRCD